MFRFGVLVAAASLVLCVGCASTSQKQQAFELQRVEGERDAYKDRLNAEQAKRLALQKRMDTEQTGWTAARAEVTSLQAQLKSLTERYDQLKAVIEKLNEPDLSRPEVPVSPLPENVDAALQKLAAALPDRVWYDRTRGGISFANDRLFDSGSATVRSDALAALRELAGVLALAPADRYDFVVVGHTDSARITKPETLAAHPTNWHLSVHRAIAVQQELVKDGLAEDRMAVMGYGATRPVSADPAQNRRVEIFIVPKGAVQSYAPVRPR